MSKSTPEEIDSYHEARSKHADEFPDVRPLNDEIRLEIVRAIESYMLNLTKEIAAGNSPSLSFLGRPHSGQEHQVLTRFSVKSSRRKMALLVFTLSKIHRLLITNSTCSRREFFYERVDLFQSQRQVDETAKHACQLLQRPPWHLCLTATSKGLVAGDLIIVTDDGHRLDCNAEPTGTLVPKNVLGIQSLESSSARFVLVVEKDTVFQKLIKEDWPRRHGHCLLVTGKGYPDVDTRLLLWRLEKELKVPLMALVDADPHGIDIMCTYRFGPSKSSRLLTAPPLRSLRWLGLHPSEISPLGLPTTPLTSDDKRLAASLLTRARNISDTQCAEAITRQVQEFMSTGQKAEIESLAKCAANFLTDVYIPRKMINSEYF